MKDRSDQIIVDLNFLLHTMSLNSSDYIYILELSQGNYHISPNFAKAFAIAEQGDDFFGIWQPFINAGDLARVQSSIQAALDFKKNRISTAYSVTDRQGNCIWMSDKATVQYHCETGTPEIIIGMIHNSSLDGVILNDLENADSIAIKIETFNRRLEAILNATPLCLNLWNRQFQNIMCNNAAVNLFELHNQQEYLERFLELSPKYQPDGSRSSEKAAAYIAQAFTGGDVVQFEWLHQKLNGEKIPAEITLVKIEGLDEDGGELIAGYTRDLREQRTMKEKIEKFNTRLEAILNATPLCLNLWNEQYENIMCNNAAVSLFDLSCHQEYLERFFELSPKYQPDGCLSSEKAAAYITQALTGGTVMKFDWRHQNLAGKEIPAEITLVKIDGLDENGGNLVVGYTRDLSAQIEAEKLQQTIHARIRAVLDSSPLACILWSTDLSIIDCNEVSVTMLGADDKFEIMQNFDYFIPKYQPDGEDSLIKIANKFKMVFKKNKINFEWVYLNKQRKEVPCQVTMVKIPLEKEGIIVGYSSDLRELHYTLALNNRLSKMAYFDLLTGISSRARFIEKLESSFRSPLADEHFALILFDIDYFKQVNDTYGHEAGDMVLKRIAKFVEKNIPDNAFIGRFGGDEFIIQIDHSNTTELYHLMEQIVQSIANITFHYMGETFTTSISMGGSFRSWADEDYHQIINRADKALYEAKAQGRNCCSLL